MAKTSTQKTTPKKIPPPKQPQSFQYRFLLPNYWGIWFGVGLLRLLSLAPLRWKASIGKTLGTLLSKLSPKRRRLVTANIQLCFPEKTATTRQAIVTEHFESLGLSLMEMGFVWWGDHKKNHAHAKERKMVHFIGEEHLSAAQQKGHGVLILAPHFTTLELTGLFVSFLTNYHAVYRPHDNPLMDYLIAKGRAIQFSDGNKVAPLSNANTRQMLKVLKAGDSMTFLPDQRYRTKGHIVVPFFNHKTKSNPATSKLAKLTQCAVVPTFTRRITPFQYEVEFLPALEHFPSGDDYEDTLRLHHLYETEIRKNPEQYLWVHNRWDLKQY